VTHSGEGGGLAAASRSGAYIPGATARDLDALVRLCAAYLHVKAPACRLRARLRRVSGRYAVILGTVRADGSVCSSGVFA
jgi:hypothetical protein